MHSAFTEGLVTGLYVAISAALLMAVKHWKN